MKSEDSFGNRGVHKLAEPCADDAGFNRGSRQILLESVLLKLAALGVQFVFFGFQFRLKLFSKSALICLASFFASTWPCFAFVVAVVIVIPRLRIRATGRNFVQVSSSTS